MKHVPTVLLSICFVMLLGLVVFFGFDLFVNSKTKLIFGKPQSVSQAVNNNVQKKVSEKIILNGDEIWDKKVGIKYKPVIENIDGLIQENKQIISSNPNNIEVLYKLGYLNLAKGNMGEASNYLERLLYKAPGDKSANLAYAYVLCGLKKYDKAYALIENIHKKDPENIDLILYQAWLFKSKGDRKKASKYYSLALSKDPKNIKTKKAIVDFNK